MFQLSSACCAAVLYVFVLRFHLFVLMLKSAIHCNSFDLGFMTLKQS